MKKMVVILAVLLAVLGFVVMEYNGMITKEEEVNSALSNLDVMLQRRADLVPNLVNTVKGYTAHEMTAIDKVTEARTKLLNANSVDEKSKANEELTSSLNALMVVVENYPDLKASPNFMQLSDELAGTENRISTARRDYNETVKNFNLVIKKFPNNLLAGMFGFEKADYFEADEGSSEVPNVSF